jgi:hypothetical protein
MRYIRRINENVDLVNKELDKFKKEFDDLTLKYRDKFSNLIKHILDTVGMEYVNDLNDEGFLSDVYIFDGIFHKFSKQNGIYHIDYGQKDDLYLNSYIINMIPAYDLYELLKELLSIDELINTYSLKITKRLNEDITSPYRTNGYMINDENRESILNLLIGALNILSETEEYISFEEELKDTYTGDGQMFESFEKINGEWYINVLNIGDYNEETDDYEDDFSESYPIKDFDIKVLASILDDIMDNPIMKYLVIHKPLKRLNEDLMDIYNDGEILKKEKDIIEKINQLRDEVADIYGEYLRKLDELGEYQNELKKIEKLKKTEHKIRISAGETIEIKDYLEFSGIEEINIWPYKFKDDINILKENKESYIIEYFGNYNDLNVNDYKVKKRVDKKLFKKTVYRLYSEYLTQKEYIEYKNTKILKKINEALIDQFKNFSSGGAINPEDQDKLIEMVKDILIKIKNRSNKLYNKVVTNIIEDFDCLIRIENNNVYIKNFDILTEDEKVLLEDFENISLLFEILEYLLEDEEVKMTLNTFFLKKIHKNVNTFDDFKEKKTL